MILKNVERRLGPVRRRHRDDRSRAAHDVAPDRSEAPDVRRGAGRQVRRLDREIYQRADDFVGEVRAAVTEYAVFIVMSDHGFHSFRGGEPQYLAGAERLHGVRRAERRRRSWRICSGGGKFWESVDWSRTKAYAVGLGQIYFNLRGREGAGHRLRGRGATRRSQNEMRAKLLTLKDPKDGQPVSAPSTSRDDIYHGEYLRNAPDLQVGFNDGYRVGWQDTLGGSRRRSSRTTIASGAATTVRRPPRSAAASCS